MLLSLLNWLKGRQERDKERKQEFKQKEEAIKRSIDFKIARIKSPASLAIVSDKVPERSLQETLHEKLALKQMHKYYERALATNSEIEKTEPTGFNLWTSKKKKLLNPLYNELEKNSYHFWRMQDKFVEFIKYKDKEIKVEEWLRQWDDLGNRGYKKERVILERKSLESQLQHVEKTNYLLSASWVFINNEEYREEFKGITPKELQSKRKENWKAYNELCKHMHEISPKYDSLEAVLIPNITKPH